MTVETVTLRDGMVVLAKRTRDGLFAVTYANNTQAAARERALRAEGVHATVIHPRFGGPRYIEIRKEALA